MSETPILIMYLQAKLAAAEELQKMAEANKDARRASRLAREVWKLKRDIYLRTQRGKK